MRDGCTRDAGRRLLPRGGAVAVAVLSLLLAAPSARAQRPIVESFDVGDGLPSAEIFDLEQDLSGRLWILSRGGLTVYDGRAFREPPGAGDLPPELFSALAVDAGGRVWAATRYTNRVYVETDAGWRRLPVHARPDVPAEGFTAGWTIDLAVLTEPEPLVALCTMAKGLLVWDGKRWTRYGARSGLPTGHMGGLAIAGGKIWVATREGLCALTRDGVDCALRERIPRLRQRVFALYAEPLPGGGERLWLLGESWLGHLDGEALRVVVDDPAIVPLEPETRGVLLVDRVGGIYFGSTRVGQFFDPARRRVTPLGLRQGLPGEGATALLLDRESNVWVGGQRGLTRIGSRRFLTWDRALGLHENEVTSVLETAPGSLVLGHNTGLSFLDRGGIETLPFDEPRSALNLHRVLDAALDPDGTVWIAAHELGLLRWRPEHGLAADTLLGDSAFAVEVDARGDLWVLSIRALFVRRDGRLERVETGFGFEDVAFLRWLAAAPDGRMVVAARRGLLWQDGEAWRLARGASEAASDVYTALPEPSGRVLVGTAAGLRALRDGALVDPGIEGLEIDRSIYLMLRDPDGRYWFGTDDGVLLWDGETLRRLSVRHGLAGRETNRGAGLVDRDGRVWIGTDQGVSVYQKRYDLPPSAAPTVELRGVEVDGELRPAGAPLELGHRQSTLLFHLDTIAFSDEANVVYRYRLDGFDAGWQQPTSTVASGIRYTNVPPGRYRLRVAAGWDGGPWGEENLSAPIAIARPLWREPWFYALAAALLALAVFGVHRLRTHRIRVRNRELREINARLEESIAERERVAAEREHLITELESKNIELERFTYTVSHDLKSPLVTIKGFVGLLEKDALDGDVERLRRDVERISAAAGTMGRLLDELLELSRIGRVVNPPTEVPLGELAREAVELAAGTAAARAGVVIEIADDLPVVWGDRVRLLEVLQNLVENAIKFRGDVPVPRVEIGVRRDRGEDVIFVRDNGIGIEPEYLEKIFGLFERLDPSVEGTGVGLALVKRIVEIHGGRIWAESAGRGRGATFCFTLPRGESDAASG